MLARHAGAARFAFNQCLRAVQDALTAKRHDPDVVVPWTGFDLINHFNTWKKTEQAGRVFAVASDGTAQLVRAGLRWRTEVCQQVFEEAAVDLGAVGLVGQPHRQEGRAAGRLPPLEDEDPDGAVVPAAEQDREERHGEHPGRGRLPTDGHPAGDRPVACPR